MSAPPHIYTLTGNLLAERTLEFETWSPGKTQRAQRESFQVGGKGINVSKMLTRLGAPNTALCFVGGASGAECDAWLRARPGAGALQAFATSTPTRTGTVVHGRGHGETTFLGADAAPDAAAVKACAEFLSAQPTGSVLAVSGSLPGWDSPDFDVLREAIHRWLERGPLVVDTYGAPLAWFAGRATTFVRINRKEIETLSPTAANGQILSSGELLRSARDRFPALRWAVTDGPAPVWFINETSEPETIPSPRVRQVSATGCGDVMMAAVLHARYHQGKSWRDAVAQSLPLAAANAAHPGVAEFPLPVA